MRLTHLLAALPFLVLPLAAPAHPHVWVDVALKIETDTRGHATGLIVGWSYDDFFTLLILEDMGLDPEADGVLTEDELARLKGFDLVEWPEGFEGDVYLETAAGPVTLSLPAPLDVRVEEGRIIATHYRAIDPVPLDGLSLRTFDPTYFVDYRLAGISLPQGCTARIDEADEAAANKAVEEMTGQTTEELFEEIEIGHLYADSARIICAGL
ncbi:DUF1007 family protein [Mesobacterium pallidum]|uniref:DUF1007 family protein n=1 Tax=Mesobacterium pallidum TaxID=2872037 RepID=UPI001EE26791|nr:DUF1007 family protein [Mesobacterium pallidum]